MKFEEKTNRHKKTCKPKKKILIQTKACKSRQIAFKYKKKHVKYDDKGWF